VEKVDRGLEDTLVKAAVALWQAGRLTDEDLGVILLVARGHEAREARDV